MASSKRLLASPIPQIAFPLRGTNDLGSGCSVLLTLEGTPRKEHFYPNISHHVYRELWALLSPHSRQNIISIFLN